MKTGKTANAIVLAYVLLLGTTRIQPAHCVFREGDGTHEVKKNEQQNDVSSLRRGLQALDPTCGVVDFELYEFPDNGSTAEPVFYPWSVLDMTDFDAINIEAIVTTGCRPACVKLTFAGHVQKETSAPYSLYGDTSTDFRKGGPSLSVNGVRELKACLYTNRACTAGEQGCLSRMVDVIPANYPLQAGPFTLTPFALVFDNVLGPATAAQTTAAATSICQVIAEYWSVNPYYKSDINVDLFECSGSAVSSASSLTIRLTTKASVTKGTCDNPYSNDRLPTRSQLSTTMKTALDSNDFMGPLDVRMIEYFVQLLNDSANPYSTVTSFSIA